MGLGLALTTETLALPLTKSLTPNPNPNPNPILNPGPEQVHRSPGFITSNLIGKRLSDGAMIKEYEASHGTVADMWAAHLRGEETSMNPLGMAEARSCNALHMHVHVPYYLHKIGRASCK